MTPRMVLASFVRLNYKTVLEVGMLFSSGLGGQGGFILKWVGGSMIVRITFWKFAENHLALLCRILSTTCFRLAAQAENLAREDIAPQMPSEAKRDGHPSNRAKSLSGHFMRDCIAFSA